MEKAGNLFLTSKVINNNTQNPSNSNNLDEFFLLFRKFVCNIERLMKNSELYISFSTEFHFCVKPEWMVFVDRLCRIKKENIKILRSIFSYMKKLPEYVLKDNINRLQFEELFNKKDILLYTKYDILNFLYEVICQEINVLQDEKFNRKEKIILKNTLEFCLRFVCFQII